MTIHLRATLVLASLALATALLADGPWGGPPPLGTPITGTSPAPPPPFQSPYDLFNRMKKDLGLETGQPDAPQPLLSEEDLLKRVADYYAEYQSSKDAKRKLELKKLIKDAELEAETRKHLDDANDFVLRRRAFIRDLIDAILSASVANRSEAYRSIFRCGIQQMQEEFTGILKQLPPEEVAPYLWERLEGQVRFSGPAAEARVAQLDAEKDQVKAQLRLVRDKLNPKPAKGAEEVLRNKEKELLTRMDELDFERTIAAAAVNYRNKAFREEAAELLAGFGAASLKPVAPGLYSPSADVKVAAASILRRIGIPAVPVLIALLRKDPSHEVAVLLTAMTNERHGRDAAAWDTWWAAHPQNPAKGKPEAEPGALAMGPAAAKPNAAPSRPHNPALELEDEPDDIPAPLAGRPEPPAVPNERDAWIGKLKADLGALRKAAEVLRAARQRQAEAMMLTQALESKAEQLTAKPGAESGEDLKALRKDLAAATVREFDAKRDVDRAQEAYEKLRRTIREE